MFTKSQLLAMNYDKKYSSFGWITNLENIRDNKLYKLYATNNASLSSGREHIALPFDEELTANHYLKYNIMK